jgi:ribosome recycling factor
LVDENEGERMIDDITNETKDMMDKALDALKKQLAQVRAGRANPALLEGVRVDYYGTSTPLSQVANVAAADGSLLTVKPWEKSMLKEIEKAIVEANLGVSTNNDGEIIRIPVPSMSQERRKELVKQAKSKGEDAKIAVRNARRDGNELLKSTLKDGDITEDDEKRGLKIVQDLTDAYVKKVDDALAKKEAEIMEV